MLLTKEVVASFDYFDNKVILGVTPIKVGLCNQNYQIDYHGGTVLFRVFGDVAKAEHRGFEFQVQQVVSHLAIAPVPLVHYLVADTPLQFKQWCEAQSKPNNGVMITEFFTGKRWSDITPLSSSAICKLAQQMHCLHNTALSSPLDEHRDGLELLAHYWNAFHDKSLSSIERFERIVTSLSDFSLDSDSLIHRDLNPTNILANADRQVIIDWEFCRNGDRYVDIATIIVELELNARQTTLLLDSYNLSAINKVGNDDKLHQCQIYYLALCWLWQPMTLNQQDSANYHAKYREQLDHLLVAET